MAFLPGTMLGPGDFSWLDKDELVLLREKVGNAYFFLFSVTERERRGSAMATFG